MKTRLTIAVSVLLISFLLSPGAAEAWQPNRPVEFVIQTSPGGGSDQYARFWIGLIEKHKLSPVPFVPVNMPGGAGAVALTHLFKQKGDPHFISPTLNSVITTPLLQKIPVMYLSEDLTPIVKMMMDPFLLVVQPQKYKTFEDFLAACRKGSLTAVGTGSRQEDEIQIFMMQHAFKCQPFRYVPEKGGGDVARAYDHCVRGAASHFVWLNRSKESLTLDLKRPEASRVLERLLGGADVFLQNLAPGAIDRLGLGADVLRARYPRLIVCNLSGYGPTGPYAAKKAYDLIIQSEVGMLSVTGTAKDQKDYSAELTRVKAEKPEVIYYGGLTPDGVRVKVQMDKLGVKAQLQGTSGIKSDTFIETAGPSAEGVYCFVEGAPTEKLPGGKKFLEAYAKMKFAEPSEAYGPFAYVATHLVIDAIVEPEDLRAELVARLAAAAAGD